MRGLKRNRRSPRHFLVRSCHSISIPSRRLAAAQGIRRYPAERFPATKSTCLELPVLVWAAQRVRGPWSKRSAASRSLSVGHSSQSMTVDRASALGVVERKLSTTTRRGTDATSPVRGRWPPMNQVGDSAGSKSESAVSVHFHYFLPLSCVKIGRSGVILVSRRTSDEELTAVGAGSEVASSLMGRVTDNEPAQDCGVAGLEEPRPSAQLVRVFGVFPSCRSNQMPATSRWQATPMARRSISDCVVRGGCGLDCRTVMEAPIYMNGCHCVSHCVIRQWVTDDVQFSLKRGPAAGRIHRNASCVSSRLPTSEGRPTAEQQAMR
jgi:hypothetical protein